MNNSRASETDQNLSAQVFGDYAVVDTMVQLERFDSVPNLSQLLCLSGIRETAECPEQHVYQEEY